jgi:hypothetical protein
VLGITGTAHAQTDWIASATGRRWLLYAKGGAAWAGDKYSAFIPVFNEQLEASETRTGWTVGGGIQFGLLFGGQADAGVRDGELDPVASVRHLAHPQGDFALFRELTGIAQQIEQNLLEPRGVRVERAQILLGFDNEAVLVLLGELSRGVIDVARFTYWAQQIADMFPEYVTRRLGKLPPAAAAMRPNCAGRRKTPCINAPLGAVRDAFQRGRCAGRMKVATKELLQRRRVTGSRRMPWE